MNLLYTYQEYKKWKNDKTNCRKEILQKNKYCKIIFYIVVPYL